MSHAPSASALAPFYEQLKALHATQPITTLNGTAPVRDIIIFDFTLAIDKAL